MHQSRWIAGTLAFALGVSAWSRAGEIVGTVVAVEGETVRIDLDSDQRPQAGDAVEIYFQLEGVDAVAQVATGKVIAAEEGRVAARLDNVQGKVREGMSARVAASEPAAPEKISTSSASVTFAVGTVRQVKEETVVISNESDRVASPGDTILFCFKIPGTRELLNSGSGQVTTVDPGAIVARITGGFVFPGHLARVRTQEAETQPPREATTPVNNAAEESDRQSAIQALEPLGGRVTQLADGRILVVDLSETEATNASLVNLTPLVDVVFLSLDNTKVTDEGLRHLRPLRQLESLSLGETAVSNVGLAHVSDLFQLESLNLRDTRITDDGLRHLRNLKKLQLLDVGGTRVTSDGVKAIATALPELKTIIGVGTPQDPGSLPAHGADSPTNDER